MNSGQNLPKFEVQFNQLPSRGIGYTEGVHIFYRGYTVGELNKVASVRQEAVTLDFLLRSALDGITTEGMDKLDLSYIDLLALGLRRRVSSEGELKWKMPYRCEKCNKIDTLVFTHSDIKFDVIEEKFEDNEVKLPIKVSIKNVDCDFWYPTVRNMLEAKDKNLKDKATVLNALMIKNLDFTTAYNLLAGLTEFDNLDDIETLKTVSKILHHNIADIQTTCKNEVLNEDTDQKVVCNHTNDVSIEGKELLLKPFRESQAPAGNKIRFGN